MEPRIELRVAELLASRLCHDLISPVGAVNSGIELITEFGDDPDGEYAAGGHQYEDGIGEASSSSGLPMAMPVRAPISRWGTGSDCLSRSVRTSVPPS